MNNMDEKVKENNTFGYSYLNCVQRQNVYPDIKSLSLPTITKKRRKRLNFAQQFPFDDKPSLKCKVRLFRTPKQLAAGTGAYLL